jgi:hypothetical protein
MKLKTIALSGALALVPFAAFGDATSETVTAATHADLAAHAADLNGVHMHLHHAVNCLVGPAGTGFDKKELNPCANAGKGAIPDTTDDTKRYTLNKAVAIAESGIDSKNLARAKKAASDTSALLKAK